MQFFTKSQSIARGWMDKDGKPKFQIKWPNTLAENNFKSGRFPDPGFKGPKFVAGATGQTAAA